MQMNNMGYIISAFRIAEGETTWPIFGKCGEKDKTIKWYTCILRLVTGNEKLIAKDDLSIPLKFSF
jgi:hypothetical protein